MPVLRVERDTVFKSQPVQSSSLPVDQRVNVAAGNQYDLKTVQKQDKHFFVELAEAIAPVGSSGYFFAEHVRIESEAQINIVQDTVFKLRPVQSSTLTDEQKIGVRKGESLPLQMAQAWGSHYLVKLQQPLPPVGQTGYFFKEHVQLQSGSGRTMLSEMRGVWLTNVDSAVLFSKEAIQRSLELLARLKFNTLYPVVWNRGHTLYPSPVAERVTGAAVHPDQSDFHNRDMLAELVELGKPMGFRIIPWFEYGLMTRPNSLLAQRHPDWLTQTSSGQKIHDNQLWLNPVHPDVVQFVVDLLAEVAATYPIDGVQLDDHLAMPVEMGYDPFTVKRYRQEWGSLTPPTNPHAMGWKQWRIGKLTELMRRVFQGVKAQNPACMLSLSPNPYDFSLNKYLADWKQWDRENIIDELVLQVYRSSNASFENELTKAEVEAVHRRIPVAIGIMAGMRTQPVSTRLIEEQIAIARRRGYAGVSFFFLDTLLNYKLSPDVPRDEQELTRLFL